MLLESKKNTPSDWVLEMWGGGDLALIDEFACSHYVYEAPGMEQVRGADDLIELVNFFGAIPRSAKRRRRGSLRYASQPALSSATTNGLR